jgi:hypothetical protein
MWSMLDSRQLMSYGSIPTMVIYKDVKPHANLQ